MPRGMNNGERLQNKGSVSSGGAWQMWHQNGTRCPKGTVPIRRSTVNDVLRAKSLYEFGKKQRRSSPHLLFRRRSDAPDVVSGNGHEVRACVRSPLIFLSSLISIIPFTVSTYSYILIQYN